MFSYWLANGRGKVFLVALFIYQKEFLFYIEALFVFLQVRIFIPVQSEETKRKTVVTLFSIIKSKQAHDS